MKLIKPHITLCLIVFFSLFIMGASNDEYVDNTIEEFEVIYDRVNSLIPIPTNFLYGLDEIVQQSESVNTTVFQKKNLYMLWLSEFIQNHDKERSYLTENDTANLLVALNSWAYLYQDVLSQLRESIEKYETSNLTVRTKDYNNKVIDNYAYWLSRLDLAGLESDKIITEKINSDGFKPHKLLYPHYLKYISPDQWYEIKPSFAVEGIKPYKKCINTYFPDEWYYMIREYVFIQNTFYSLRDVTNKISKHYNSILSYNDDNYKEHSKSINLIREYIVSSDLLFKKFDKISRYFIFDAPILHLSRYSFLRARAAKHWIDNDEEIKNALLDFAAIKQFKFTAFPFTDRALIETRKEFKEAFDDNELAEIEAEVTLRKEWYELLPRVNAPQPDKKFE
ncbi:MAG: hypothetical protein HF981_19475 [Desulfobacteraceae bacterium]|nr:hypothetical protein [Desulfobacteraceae bacterium]MBC2752582.1 hypothetical protein [Desulfobacteraceae bacterium]